MASSVVKECRLEMRSVIKFLHMKGKKPNEIHSELKDTYQDKAPSLFIVQYWVRRFRCGFSNISDDARSGRPVSALTVENVDKVRKLILEDRHITLAQIVYETRLSKGSIVTIIHDHLAMSKVTARWVPRLLTDEMKAERLRCSNTLLNHANDTPNFFDRLVTVDESWVYQYDPEMKYQSKEWRTASEGAPRKAQRSRSSVKVMLTVFWDAEGVIMTDFLTQGNNMNKEHYSKLILSLRSEYRKKRPQKQRIGHMLLLQDNAPPHKAGLTQETIRDCGFELLPHPAYSPDLAPSDFFLFPEMTRELKCTRFEDTEAIKRATIDWLSGQPPHAYFQGLFKVKARWEKCVTLAGDYVEK